MQSREDRERSLPAAWPGVLDRIQQALVQAVTEATRQQKELETMIGPAQPTAERDGVCNRGLEQLVERLRGLQTSFEKAEAEAAAAAGDLASDADAFNQWLTLAQETQRRLANLGTSGIR